MIQNVLYDINVWLHEPLCNLFYIISCILSRFHQGWTASYSNIYKMLCTSLWWAQCQWLHCIYSNDYIAYNRLYNNDYNVYNRLCNGVLSFVMSTRSPQFYHGWCTVTWHRLCWKTIIVLPFTLKLMCFLYLQKDLSVFFGSEFSKCQICTYHGPSPVSFPTITQLQISNGIFFTALGHSNSDCLAKSS